MTPKALAGVKDHGRGSLVIDKTFKGVGRVKRASGTSDAKVYRRLVAMLDTLVDAGRLDLVRAIKDQRLHPLELWEHYRSGRLDGAPNPETLKPLTATALAWVKQYKGRRGAGVSERHRYELQQKLKNLATVGTKDATVADLPDLLAKYRDQCLADGFHRQFNYTKSAAQAFARAIYGRASVLYRDISAVEALEATRKRQGNPQPPAAAIALREKLAGEAGAIWWTLCNTGMMPDELWGGKWRIERDRIRIDGTKTGPQRRRVIPPLVFPQKPRMSRRLFAARLTKASGGRVEPYDGRRTFAHWLELAGIPRSRLKAYMGHKTGDVTDLYLRHEVEPYLVDDTARLWALFGDQPAPKLVLVQGGKP